MPVFNRQELIKALRLVSSVVPDKTPTPVLQFVSMKSLDGVATLAATDHVVYVVTTVPCSDDFSECLLPATHLLGLLSASTSESVTITVTSNGVMMVDATGTYTMPTPDKAEFPSRDKVAELTFSTDSIYINRALPLVLACVDDKSGGGAYYIEGVRFDCTNGVVQLVSTDQTRLCVCVLGSGNLEPFTIPRPVVKLVSQMQGKISIGCDGDVATFVSDTMTVTSRTMVGAFPKYQKVLDRIKSHELWSVKAEELEEALRKACLFTQAETQAVNLSIGETTTKITSQGADVGKCGISVGGGSAASGSVIVNGQKLLGFLQKVPASLPVEFKVKSDISIRVGDFCQLLMSSMEVR